MQVVIVGLVVLIVGLLAGNKAIDQQTKYFNNVQSLSSEEIIVPTIKPVTNFELKESENLRQVEIPSPTLPGEQIVNCTISLNCGGGTRKLYKNACDNSICCQVNDKWSLYPSRELCDEHQKEWGEYVQALNLINSGYYSDWANQKIKKYQTDMKNIVSDFNTKAKEIIDEAENYKANIPPPTDYTTDNLDKEIQNTINTQPTLKPKCPPTYFSGDVSVGGELPCEP